MDITNMNNSFSFNYIYKQSMYKVQNNLLQRNKIQKNIKPNYYNSYGSIDMIQLLLIFDPIDIWMQYQMNL